tara:strand:- start:65 stop:205 length:141 start_codon:yes stop_codon:yes gene_type:complete
LRKKFGGIERRTNGPKKTRQGMGRHTKYGNKLSAHYKKKSRGQGKV